MINVGIFCMFVEDILLVEVKLIKSVDSDKHAPNKKEKIWSDDAWSRNDKGEEAILESITKWSGKVVLKCLRRKQ